MKRERHKLQSLRHFRIHYQPTTAGKGNYLAHSKLRWSTGMCWLAQNSEPHIDISLSPRHLLSGGNPATNDEDAAKLMVLSQQPNFVIPMAK